METVMMDRDQRVSLYRALADERRLAIVDELRRSDRTPSMLGQLTKLPSNLLAFHLDALESVGVVRRVRSEGDRRRRYVQLAWDPECLAPEPPVRLEGPVLFVCTRNAARSQLAAALWARHGGTEGLSAGTIPANTVDDGAQRVARHHGLTLGRRRPRHLDTVTGPVGLVVTVCDRAREAGGWPEAADRHWSVPDPAGGPPRAYEVAYERLAGRVEDLARQVAS